jgi:hypothetical protein
MNQIICVGLVGDVNRKNQIKESLINIGIEIKSLKLGFVVCDYYNGQKQDCHYIDYFTNEVIGNVFIKAFIFIPGDLNNTRRLMKELQKHEKHTKDAIPIIIYPEEFGIPLMNQIRLMIDEGFTNDNILKGVITTNNIQKIKDFIKSK